MKFSIRRVNEWLIVIMSVVIIAFSMKYLIDQYDFFPFNFQYAFNPHSSTVIIGLNTVSAIEIFGGGEAIPYEINWMSFSMYINVFLYLMVGPFLLFKGFIKSKSNEERAKPWYWYIGAMICVFSFAIIPTEIIQLKVFQNTLKSANQSRAMDQLRSEAADVGLAVAQYEILEDGLNEEFMLTEMNMDLRFEYELESVSSDTLATFTVRDPMYEGNDLTLKVYPYHKKVFSVRDIR